MTSLRNHKDLIGIALLAALLVIVLPLTLDIFRLNLFGKYLTYAFVALGLVVCWGDAGILSLGQGVFFGLGGYCMAMFLKLEASSVANTKIQSTPGIPDFMDWNQLTALPWFWEPFHNLAFTLVAIVAVPTLFALLIGVAMFKRRVGGVYFAIITQALAAILTILIVGRQGYTGGNQRHHRSADAGRLGHPHRPRQIHSLFPQRRPADRGGPAGPAGTREQARPHPRCHARQGGPRSLLRLRRRQF
jgi:urea transport system permease protein